MALFHLKKGVKFSRTKKKNRNTDVINMENYFTNSRMVALAVNDTYIPLLPSPSNVTGGGKLAEQDAVVPAGVTPAKPLRYRGRVTPSRPDDAIKKR